MSTADSLRIERAAAGAAELEAIGSMLFGHVDDVAAIVETRHFADERCRIVFDACIRLHREGRTVTAEAVAPLVARGGVSTDDLCEMVESVPHGLHAGYHAARVLAGWKRREFGYAMTSAKQSLADPTADVDDVLTATANALECIRDASSPQDDSGAIGDALLTVMSTPEASRIESGLFDLDVLLSGGFAPGQLVTIGARPSVGKTALCSGIALAMARQRVPVLYLSLEMTQREMTTRLMSQSGIDGFDHSDALTELSRLPLFIREAAGWTIERVETIARQYSRRHHVRVVVVDYLSLIRPRDARLPRWEQVSDISRSLKLIALRNDLAVIAAQQLGRAIEDRPDHRPRMSDFRESGSIEQDSDILAAIERPTRPDEGDMTAARLHVLKHRNGSTGIIDLRFDPARTLFADAGFTA